MSNVLPKIKNLSKLGSAYGAHFRILTVVNSLHIRATNSLSHKTLQINNLSAYDPNVMVCRHLAKSKDKIKKGGSRTVINDNELSEVFDVQKLYEDFRRPLVKLKTLYVEQLSLRTSTTAIEDIKVNWEGSTYLLQDLAEIGRKSTKEVILEMEAFSGAIPSVIESLRKSALRLNPIQQGTSIIIPIPKVTREHRETLAKGAKALFNNCKDSIKDVQNKNIKKLDKFENMSKDTNFQLKAQLTALGDQHIAEAQEILKAKEKELLSTD